MSKVEFKSVSEALSDLNRRGYSLTFEPVENQNAELRIRESGQVYPAASLTIMQVFRFEGETDPADMSVVYALESSDGQRGTIIDAYGAYGDSEVGDALRSLKMKEQSGEINERTVPVEGAPVGKTK